MSAGTDGELDTGTRTRYTRATYFLGGARPWTQPPLGMEGASGRMVRHWILQTPSSTISMQLKVDRLGHALPKHNNHLAKATKYAQFSVGKREGYDRNEYGIRMESNPQEGGQPEPGNAPRTAQARTKGEKRSNCTAAKQHEAGLNQSAVWWLAADKAAKKTIHAARSPERTATTSMVKPTYTKGA